MRPKFEGFASKLASGVQVHFVELKLIELALEAQVHSPTVQELIFKVWTYSKSTRQVEPSSN